jgi:hypothetical protein
VTSIDGVPFPHIGSTARFSLDGRYRYELTRRWARGPVACWVMLNPSTADAVTDDATIRRCTRFTRDWGLSGMVVVNLFAYRTVSPAELKREVAPIGPLNDEAIHDAAVRARVVIAAWGAHGSFMDRANNVHDALNSFLLAPLTCLGMTMDGSPRHPLRLPASLRPEPYKRET